MIIEADWPAPKNIKAYSTLRTGGVSTGAFDSLNLGYSTADNAENVKTNRALLSQTLKLPNEPCWVYQIHSNIAVPATQQTPLAQADATYTKNAQQVCAVMTADCLPLLVCNQSGTHVAAIHAGWRGLSSGIIESTLQGLNLPPNEILVWLGPAIGPEKFEVGDEVRNAFMQVDNNASQAFKATRPGHWMADLYTLARQRLNRQGITQIYGGKYCTFTDEKLFFSHRRDQGKTGRMASLIWIE